MNNRFGLLIFDLDGTLVDAFAAVAESINFTLRQLGKPIQEFDDIKRSVGWGDRQLLVSFIGEAGTPEALRIYREHHLIALPLGCSLLPGAKEVLDQLRHNGVRMAVATNRPSPYTKVILECLGIAQYFDSVLCADEVANGKPAPDLILETLKRFDVSPDEALYVGDMTIDVQAGHNAGIKAAVVLTGTCFRHEIEPLNPYLVADDLKHLASMLGLSHRGDTVPQERH